MPKFDYLFFETHCIIHFLLYHCLLRINVFSMSRIFEEMCSKPEIVFQFLLKSNCFMIFIHNNVISIHIILTNLIFLCLCVGFHTLCTVYKYNQNKRKILWYITTIKRFCFWWILIIYACSVFYRHSFQRSYMQPA